MKKFYEMTIGYFESDDLKKDHNYSLAFKHKEECFDLFDYLTFRHIKEQIPDLDESLYYIIVKEIEVEEELYDKIFDTDYEFTSEEYLIIEESADVVKLKYGEKLKEFFK